MAISDACFDHDFWKATIEVPRDITAQARWKITTDGVNDGPIAILNNAYLFSVTPAIPKEGDTYNLYSEPVSYLIARSISVERTPVKNHWWYEVQYGERESHNAGTGPGGLDPFDPIPTDRPAREWMEFDLIQIPAIKDKDGNIIANSAKDPFDPPLMIDQSVSVMVFQKNKELTMAQLATHADTYVGHVNSLTFKGKPPRSLLMKPLRVQPLTSENDKLFFPVEYRIAIAPNGGLWEETPVDQGWRYLDGGVKVVPRDADGYAPAEPILLNGIDGNKLADNVVGVLLDGQGGRLGPIRPYPEVDFAALGI